MYLRPGQADKYGDKAMKVSFVGGGNMGEAIIAALITHRLAQPEDISVADAKPERQEYLAQRYGIFATGYNLEAIARSKVVILAIKPQQTDDVTCELKGHLQNDQLVLSIIAGRKLSALRQGLRHEAIVRAMPNTPAQIGQGMTVWTATDSTPAAHRADAEAILGTMGCAVYTSDEATLDAVTAISGSGPAYVFLFLESLIQAGRDIGLSPELARLLAFKTMLGSTEYAQQSDKTLTELIRNVTSPGGTTAAALKIFEGGDFSGLIKQAAMAAFQRAQELGG